MELGLGDAPRALRAGGVLGKREQVKDASVAQHRRQAPNVSGAIVVVEDVEDTRVDDSREFSSEPVEVEHVTDSEVHLDTPLLGLLARTRDRVLGRSIPTTS